MDELGQAPDPQSRLTAIGLAMIGLAVVSLVTVADNVPSAMSPFSIPVVIATMAGGTLLGMAIVPLAFLLWSIPLLVGRAVLPSRSIVLAVLFAVVMVAWFVMGWAGSVQHNGSTTTVVWAAMNACFGIALLSWVRPLRRSASWLGTLMFHWVLFAWIGWCGFPWIGEVP